MSSSMIVILACAVIALVIGVVLASRDGGPRVTTIERKTKRAEDEGEEEDRS